MSKYLKTFINLKSASEILPIFLTNKKVDKEITESFSMVEAAKNYVSSVNDSKVFVIGDGAVPRTGVLFAYLSKAEVVSIDPSFNMEKVKNYFDKYNPQRLTVIKEKVEDIELDGDNKQVIVVWPHSHAPMEKIKIKNYSSLHYISLPCCVPIPNKLMNIPHIVYRDENVLSVKNIVHIWTNLKQRI